ncbi:MAG: hypothetical protein WBD51_10355 [Burkholderiaceae bacterium]
MPTLTWQPAALSSKENSNSAGANIIHPDEVGLWTDWDGNPVSRSN